MVILKDVISLLYPPTPKNFGYKLAIIHLLFQERDNCTGGKDLQDGECPDFKCINHSSCKGNGNCNGDGTACVCQAGFSGADCSIDLQGDILYVDTKMNESCFPILLAKSAYFKWLWQLLKIMLSPCP